jgi:hypothetical protein
MNNSQIKITSILEEIKQFQQSSVKNCQTAAELPNSRIYRIKAI